MSLYNDAPYVIGIVASVLTGGCMLPQLIKILQKKKADNVSMLMIGVLITGTGLWIVYGFYKKDYIIVVSNAFSFIANTIIAILAYVYKRKQKPRLRRI